MGLPQPASPLGASWSENSSGNTSTPISRRRRNTRMLPSHAHLGDRGTRANALGGPVPFRSRADAHRGCRRRRGLRPVSGGHLCPADRTGGPEARARLRPLGGWREAFGPRRAGGDCGQDARRPGRSRSPRRHWAWSRWAAGPPAPAPPPASDDLGTAAEPVSPGAQGSPAHQCPAASEGRDPGGGGGEGAGRLPGCNLGALWVCVSVPVCVRAGTRVWVPSSAEAGLST